MTDNTFDTALLRRYSRRNLSTGRGRLVELFGGRYEVASDGALVYTDSGETLLNCAGYGVFLLGACHPHVVEAVCRQVMRHPVATRILGEPTVVHAAAELAACCPEGLEKVHFSGSGTEAVETAIKLARANGCTRLISMEQGYHGKTLGSLSVTANPLYQDPFAPLLPSEQVPYDDAAALERVLASDDRACVIVEAIQGEAGVRIPHESYLPAVRQLCDSHGAILVVDEIQTGLGRVGSWWACDQVGVRPDILTVGKGLSGGVVPVSATVTTQSLFRPFDRDPYLHTSTFSGAPIAMAAVRAALAALRFERAPERAAQIGDRLLDGLRSRLRDAPGVVDIRGRGLLLGIEMSQPGQAGELMRGLMLCGVLANHSLNASRVVRLTPPAMLTDDQIDWVLDAFDSALKPMIAPK